MFFGLEIKSNENQAKPITLANTVKFSQAVLDPSKNGKKEPVCLIAEYNKRQFILCVVDPSHGVWQCPLDLLFEGGSQVKFFLRGSGSIHLTGYENFDDLDDMSMSMSDEEDAVTDTDDDTNVVTTVAAKRNGRDTKAKTNGFKSPNKKKNNKKEEEEEDLDDEDDSDDEDFGADLDEEDDDDDLEDEDDDDDDEDDVDEDMEDSDEE